MKLGFNKLFWWHYPPVQLLYEFLCLCENKGKIIASMYYVCVCVYIYTLMHTKTFCVINSTPGIIFLIQFIKPIFLQFSSPS